MMVNSFLKLMFTLSNQKKNILHFDILDILSPAFHRCLRGYDIINPQYLRQCWSISKMLSETFKKLIIYFWTHHHPFVIESVI